MNFKLILSALAAASTASAAIVFPSSGLLEKPSYSTTIKPSATGSKLPSPVQSAGFNGTMYDDFKQFTPKVFIINMFSLEESPFLETYDFVNEIRIPGLSPIYNTISCDEKYELCQITTGEGEINAASTLTALSLSPVFDLSKTFFLIAGIAGISPLQGTIGDVTFARFAVQILEYEVDSRDLPSNWTTGYFDFGTDQPGQYPENIYGTEVFELNENLRDRALDLAQQAFLYNGTKANEAMRLSYNYAPANRTPQAIACDTLTGDTYWFGELLDETFANYTSLLTNGTGNYCSTQQEDNASLEALIRASMYGLVDFTRIVVMRSASDFTYSDNYSGNQTVDFFDNVYQGGITASLVNLVYASKPFISDILDNFHVYDSGKYAPDNYVGDFFNSLEADVTLRTWGTPEWGTA
jgi:purine nucleoside permease